MFNKKEMKLISYKKAQQYLVQNVEVFMVELSGEIVPITKDMEWSIINSHANSGGLFAVYRKSFVDISEFTKSVNVFGKTIGIEHKTEGGESSWNVTIKDKE